MYQGEDINQRIFIPFGSVPYVESPLTAVFAGTGRCGILVFGFGHRLLSEHPPAGLTCEDNENTHKQSQQTH